METEAHVNSRIIGLFVIFVSIVLFVTFVIFRPQIILILESTISSDSHISPRGVQELTLATFFGSTLLLGTGYCLVKANSLAWRRRMKQVIFRDPLNPNASVWLSPTFILIASSVIGLLLIISIKVAYHLPSMFALLYTKDHGVIDLAVPITMFISAGLLGSALWTLRKKQKYARYRTLLSVVYPLMVSALLFYVGEETSWGQDFFRWQTPELFSGNLEGQTNIHNYFNRLFDYGYIALSLILPVVLVSIWMEFNQRWLPLNRFFLPHPSLIGLSLLIAFIAIVQFREEELLEEMVATFTFFYSLRIFACARSSDSQLSEGSDRSENREVP